jgi:hypothetical protein
LQKTGFASAIENKLSLRSACTIFAENGLRAGDLKRVSLRRHALYSRNTDRIEAVWYNPLLPLTGIV